MGTSSPDSRIVSATPFSSPKLGSTTRTPSIRRRCSSNSAAQTFASARVSTPPSLVAASSTITASMSISANRRRTSARASVTRASGKNSRLPTITPRVALAIVHSLLDPRPVRPAQMMSASTVCVRPRVSGRSRPLPGAARGDGPPHDHRPAVRDHRHWVDTSASTRVESGPTSQQGDSWPDGSAAPASSSRRRRDPRGWSARAHAAAGSCRGIPCRQARARSARAYWHPYRLPAGDWRTTEVGIPRKRPRTTIHQDPRRGARVFRFVRTHPSIDHRATKPDSRHRSSLDHRQEGTHR